MLKKVGLIFGGLGNEAGVSVVSARNVAENFDREKYQLVLVYWHTDGFFYAVNGFAEIKAPKRRIQEADFVKIFDVALLMTHGKYGEDGVLQAILERQKVKYCGCWVLSSALCMDKAVCKQYLSGQKIAQVDFRTLDFGRLRKDEIEAGIASLKKEMKLPVFVKPSNSGSSVGISKVIQWADLERAVKLARKHDAKVVIEQGLVKPREIEVGILGNGQLEVSRPGELAIPGDFYDYDEKYKKGRTEVQIPAKLNAGTEQKIRALAEKVYRLCDCRGFARLDFFISDGKIYFNEINTLPGFTQFSMYPLLMRERVGSYKELINRIIALA